ncbi:hypothetical protein I3760_11G190500 [Carya illinoinensis]|uniref:Zinc finger PHD-type domain-containing protein n=1 Tax=Carya illinoinensis TaxID=32201 RepID=A0A922DS46_CARIL|nr:hypothetical protein I3760_11G190500 [Carya illinoinensis]KAG2682421.1 hypothetical protein I3760_11G190500 [Carya illinoinensis]KAG2682422.1 hypothetical protein I3760_11G190500 [Carya illinoinensis]KAG2682424.1 hypothetical protein I3760_11G190500 [Carya illinoinensis]KAG6689821.1 hypothetical protein I3842_11G193400 [Carya illinoinensis]
MASSDDEADVLPRCVSNYYFEDDEDEPISFSVLPIQWREGDIQDCVKEQIFLHGVTDNGLRKIYKHVVAWRFDLSNMNPEILVLSKENNWIKLQKPRKSFEDIIRTIMVTVRCLHFLKKNPEASGKSLWDHLSKVFSLYEVRPSQNDLVDHIPLISEAVNRDDTLAKSKFLYTFLKEKPGKRKLSDEDCKKTAMSGFIVYDLNEEEEDESNKVTGVYDHVCAFCDNGGNILSCEGRCIRSFHATKEAGAESNCVSLGFSSKKEVDELPIFVCKNCKYKQHQCFACGKLGSSDKFSGAEVFKCVSATCGYFYHPHCVAKLLHQENKVAAEELEKKIAAGGSFTCPIHKCYVCKRGENKKDHQLQFAVCRRCPKSYHRKCLPRKISFGEGKGIVTRAWEDLLPNRILIYCLKHEIDNELRTPVRDHIKFPGVMTITEKRKVTVKEKKKSSGYKDKDLSKTEKLALDDSCRETALQVAKQNQKSSSLAKLGNAKNSKKVVSISDISRKGKVNDSARKLPKENANLVLTGLDRSSATDENKYSLGDRLFDLMKRSGQLKPTKQDALDGNINKSVAVKPHKKKLKSAPSSLDANTERRLLTLMRDAASSITLEEIKEKHKVPSSHSYSSKNNVEKIITIGKLEGSVEAIRTAFGKLEEGCSLEDAEAVCEPDILRQIFRWKNMLQVYLAPFLNGNRYTSYGRHFTKMEKIEEIVDKLHWYVQNNDMIVDFCCGANDFSILMKKKLEETGKICSYKNYDIFQPKNDFNFEKRDWMTVQPKELPAGSRLIMGLNPPFGVRASLANKFIDKALEFNPKLLILIVPPETQKLDEKKRPYDLIWEDNQSLSGKSFYLPGSVGENDKQMDQWNSITPPLSLWSHSHWTAKHKSIAEKHGHISKQKEGSDMEKNPLENRIHDHPADGHDRYGDTSVLMDDLSLQSDSEKFRGGAVVSKCHVERSPSSKGYKENLENDHGKNQPDKTSTRKRKRDKGKHRKRMGQVSSEKKRDSGKLHHSLSSVVERRFLSESQHSKAREMPSHAEIGENGHQHLEPRTSGSRMQFAAGYGGSQVNIPKEMGRKNNMSGNEPYSSGTDRGLVDGSPGHMRDSSDRLSYRSYDTRVEEGFTRDTDFRLQGHHYGLHDPHPPGNNYFTGHDGPYGDIRSMPWTYGHPGPAADFSYRMNTSAMQRYAPQLDELNHPRPMNTFTSELPMMNATDFYNRRASQPEYQSNRMDFAPGPRRPYSHQSSVGWLNE